MIGVVVLVVLVVVFVVVVFVVDAAAAVAVVVVVDVVVVVVIVVVEQVGSPTHPHTLGHDQYPLMQLIEHHTAHIVTLTVHFAQQWIVFFAL